MKLKNLTGFLLIWVLLLVVFGCSPLKNVQVEERSGKRIAFIKEGVGSPSVIFESGFEGGMETWAGIIDSVAMYTSVYAYDRAGYGRSNLKDPPHSIEELAQQLHTNLIARNIPPPYVLVGYSGGALFISMFARLYPDKVKGVLMIDPTHPDLYDYLRENEALIYDLLFDYVGEGQRRYEFDLIKNSSKEFRDAPDFPDVPLIVLMAGRHTTLESEALRDKMLEFHEDLKKLSPYGTRYLIEDSGHSIHKSDPQLVVDHILGFLDGAN
ncbi:MAG: alpha/beta hydrolase [Flavobacteriaceae bacterium]